MPRRYESSLITAFILLFVLRPTLVRSSSAWIALAGAVASVEVRAGVARAPHPEPGGGGSATALTSMVGARRVRVVGRLARARRSVIVLGLAVLSDREVRVIAVFFVVAVWVALVRSSAADQAVGQAVEVADVFWPMLWSSPFLFLGAFMLSEPLTLPPRRGQQFPWPASWESSPDGRSTSEGSVSGRSGRCSSATRWPSPGRPHRRAPGAPVPGRRGRRRFVNSRSRPPAGAFGPASTGARSAASATRRARHTARVQHRLGAGGSAGAARGVQGAPGRGAAQHVQEGARRGRAGGDAGDHRGVG